MQPDMVLTEEEKKERFKVSLNRKKQAEYLMESCASSSTISPSKSALQPSQDLIIPDGLTNLPSTPRARISTNLCKDILKKEPDVSRSVSVIKKSTKSFKSNISNNVDISDERDDAIDFIKDLFAIADDNQRHNTDEDKRNLQQGIPSITDSDNDFILKYKHKKFSKKHVEGPKFSAEKANDMTTTNVDILKNRERKSVIVLNDDHKIARKEENENEAFTNK